MDNYFQIYRPYLRHAEKTDTRAAIQRQQKEQQRERSEDERLETGGTLFAEDEMTVSLQALVGLLEDLLRQGKMAQGEGDDGTKAEDEEGSSEDNEPAKVDDMIPDKPPRNNTAAAQAYQHAAETGGVKQPPAQPQAPTTNPDDHNAAGIPADEIDVGRIRTLLDKARELQDMGVEEIKFTDTGDFLVMLERTVDTYLAG